MLNCSLPPSCSYIKSTGITQYLRVHYFCLQIFTHLTAEVFLQAYLNTAQVLTYKRLHLPYKLCFVKLNAQLCQN